MLTDICRRVVEEKIRPILQTHGGDIELLDVDAEGFAKVRLTGACGGCPGAQHTLHEIVEAELRQGCPEIKGIIPVFTVDQELIEAALKILRGGKVS